MEARAGRGPVADFPDSVSSIDGSVRTAEVDVLAFGPESPSTLYAVAAFYSDSGHFSRAVYRSTDAGETWTAAGRGLEDTLVNTLAADPVVPGRLFAGTQDGGVFLSEDAGTTWTAMSTGLTGAPVVDLALSTGSPATLWAATAGGGVFDFQLARFADVSPASGFSAWIDALASAGITAGCAHTAATLLPRGEHDPGADGHLAAEEPQWAQRDPPSRDGDDVRGCRGDVVRRGVDRAARRTGTERRVRPGQLLP